MFHMPKIHELDRIVVEFASLLGNGDHYPLSAESQMWLVCETTEPTTPPVWRALGNVQWAYSFMSSLCQKMAVEAELKQRLVNGKSLKAEEYIGQWRQEMKSPRSLADLSNYGIQLLGRVAKPVQGLQEEAKRSPEKRVEEAMESPFVTERTDDKVTWTVPLTGLGNLKAYMGFASIWLSSEVYPDQVNEVVVGLSDAGAAAASAGLTFDLFAGMELAA
jgi:hypothetical protein